MRRSLMLPSSATAMARKSSTIAMGSPWKWPPLMTRSSSGSTIGLSVVELISVSMTEAT